MQKRPAAQLTQAPWPCWLWKVPAAHVAHSVLPVPAAKLPSLHTAQEVAPGEAEALPAAQGVHVAELAVEKEPAAHCVQPAAPAPAAPVTTPAKPAPQTLHEVAPAPGVEKPGLQTRHVFAFVAFTVVLKVPTEHCVQEGAFETDEKLPAAQPKQLPALS